MFDLKIQWSDKTIFFHAYLFASCHNNVTMWLTIHSDLDTEFSKVMVSGTASISKSNNVERDNKG